MPVRTSRTGGVTRPAPLTPGAAFQLNYHTDPNALVVVFAGPRLGTNNLFALLEQPVWLNIPQSLSAALVAADVAGNATATWTTPTGPGISNQRLWFQGIAGLTTPLQASGGIVR